MAFVTLYVCVIMYGFFMPWYIVFLQVYCFTSKICFFYNNKKNIHEVQSTSNC